MTVTYTSQLILSYSELAYNYEDHVFTNVAGMQMPLKLIYVGKAVTKPSTDNFYWINRIIGALADAHFAENASNVERYQIKINNKMNEMINKFDEEYANAKDKEAFFEKANQEISDFVEKETLDYLDKVLFTSSCLMKNGFSRSDA